MCDLLCDVVWNVFVCFKHVVCLCVFVCDEFNMFVCCVGGSMYDAICYLRCWFVSVCLSVV